MRKFPTLCQNHRREIGKHTNFQNKHQSNQKAQNLRVQRLASRPGLHTENINTQTTAQAMLQLISILTTVQYNNVRAIRPSIKPLDAGVLKNSKMPFSAQQTLAMGGSVTMLSWATGLLNEAGAFMIRHDPLRFPVAHALPINLNNKMNPYSNLQRKSRYVPLPTKSTATTFAPDDVKAKKMFDFSCMNNGEELSMAQIFRQVGNTLQNPSTAMSADLANMDSWYKGQGCASLETIDAISNVTKKVDEITSQIISLLPGSKLLAVLHYLVGPLLERAANDLEGKPTPLSKELALLQQINLETRLSYNMILDRDKDILKNTPSSDQKSGKIELPEFHIVDSNSGPHIDMQYHGKAQMFPVTLNEKNRRILAVEQIGTKGEVKKHQVYYNFLTKKWEKTGNGNFNHYSKRERQLVQKLGLQIQSKYPSNFNDKAATYNVLNPYFSEPKRLDAVVMFGHLVPYYYEPKTGKEFIYDASMPEKIERHEIVLAQGEWHLKALPNRNIKIKTLYSPLHSRYLNVAVANIKNGQEILAQYNIDTNYFFGQKFVLNSEGNLEALPFKFEKSATEEKNMIYDEKIDCYYYRVKRGANFGKLCPPRNSFNANSAQEKSLSDNTRQMMAEGSIGKVYDTGDGYVIKEYKGKIDARHKSRLQAANKNAKGFNRYYGPSSATVRISDNADETASVSVRLKKIEGNPLDSIRTMTDKNQLIDIASSVEKYSPAGKLANTLQNKGIIHNDINQGNIIYSKEKGFSIIDFDSAHFLGEGEVVSELQTASMKKKFLHVFSETLRDIDKRLQEL